MAKLADKKAAFLEQLERDIMKIPASQTVPSGQFVTAGHLAMELARYTLDPADTKIFEAFASTANDDLQGTIDRLAYIYSRENTVQNLDAYTYQATKRTFFGRDYSYIEQPGIFTILFEGILFGHFRPSLIGPDGELPETIIPGTDYTLTGETDGLEQNTPLSRASAYFIHRLATEMAAKAGEPLSIHIKKSCDDLVFETYAPVIHTGFYLPMDRLDRRAIDLLVDEDLEVYSAQLSKQRADAENLDRVKSEWQAAINANMKDISPPNVINVSPYTGSPAGYTYNIALECATLAGTEIMIDSACELDLSRFFYILKDHRKAIKSKKEFASAGGYQINGVFAAFLYSRYGNDYQQVIDAVLATTQHVVNLPDPSADNKTVRFTVQLRSNELRGRFQLAPGVTWDYTKMVFTENIIPLTVRAGLLKQPLSKLVDVSSVPGLESAVITGIFEREQGCSLTIAYELMEIDAHMASLSTAASMRQAA